MLSKISAEVKQAVSEICTASKIQPGEIFVIGCSSSEISGGTIGKNSSEEIGKAVFDAAYEILNEKGIYLAAQCCEHLNRALVIESKAAEKYLLPPVNAVPQVKAGGSFATAAYHGFSHPCVVEHIAAKAGMDIGETLIGMHIAPVCVPLRISVRKIGEANVICARSRLKFIGGIRARYDENLL